MYLFFDTETTGLPKNYKAPVTDTNNWPRVIQIAWMRFDKAGVNLGGKEYIIRPNGFEIPKESSDIHRITTEIAMEKGVALPQVLTEFCQAVTESEVIVGHNIDFDCSIMGAECVRENVPHVLGPKKKVCTMKSTKNFCRLPGMYGYKWPKLTELHVALFGTGFAESHSALADIEACAKCFWELSRRGVLKY